MTLFSLKSKEPRDEGAPSGLDSRSLSVATTVVLILLLVVFYVVTMMNMGAIANRVNDLNEGPYPVTIAAGEVESNLIQLRTLADRLIYVRTPEAVDKVDAEYAAIHERIKEPLAFIDDRYSTHPEEADALAEDYEKLKSECDELVELCRNPLSTDVEIETMVNDRIVPLSEDMLKRNSLIIDDSHQSFTSLYDLANAACTETMVSASLIMGAVLVALVIFLAIIRRRNIQRDRLQHDLENALDAAHHANQAKSQFFVSMSHDIRTPCSAIVGLTEIAERHAENPDRVRECLSKITLSSHHLLNLINDVLDMSKIENGQLALNDESFNLKELVDVTEAIVHQQARTKKLELVVNADDSTNVQVQGDALRLRQVLLNLVGNAVKYTEPGGHVRVSATRIEGKTLGEAGASAALSVEEDAESSENPAAAENPSEATAHADETRATCSEEEGVWFRFEIEDDGIGMTAEFLERIFDPFERELTDETSGIEGTGLGMPIAKNLVDQMNGVISVQSERHRGTTFVVELPLPLAETAAAEAVSGEKRTSPNLPIRVNYTGLRALLAEDDEINAEIACDILKRAHIEVEWAHDGEEAVFMLMDEPDGHFDIVFMDVQMPNMDGLRASQVLHETCERERRTCPIIVAMTANAYVEDKKKALAAGMDGYLVKPFGFGDVCRTLDALIPFRSETSSDDASEATKPF